MCNSIYIPNSFCHELLCRAGNETIMSAITQIQIAQVAVIVTLLSISMAVSKDKIFGLQVKDLLSIEGDWKFRFFVIYMILQLVLLIVSVCCLLCMASTITLLSFLLSVAASIVISCIYIPVITISEKRALSIIRNAASSDKNKVNKDKIMNALWAIASQLDCKQSIEKLTCGLNDDKQKEVISLLLDKVTERIRNINQSTSINDIKIILDYTEGLLYIDDKLLKVETARIIGIVAASVFYIEKHERIISNCDGTSNSIVTSVVDSLVKYLDYQNSTERAHIMMLIICRIIKYSVEDSSANISRICRDEFAQAWGFYGEKRNSLKRMTFFEISRYYYYLLYLDNSIPQQIKDTAHKCLNDNETLNPHQRTMSWKTMLESLIEEMPIDINVYADAYFDKNDWEYSVCNVSRWVILTDESLFDWWIKCRILSCESVLDLKAAQICDKYKIHMMNALSQYCDDTTKRYDTSKSVDNLVKWLGLQWNMDENVEENLFALKNELANETMICKTSMDDSVLASLDSRIMMNLTELMQKTCLAVEKNDMSNANSPLFTMNLWQELPAKRDEYLASAEKHIGQIIYEHIIEHIRSLIDQSKIKTINIRDNKETKLLKILKETNPMYHAEPISRYLSNMPAYKEIADEVETLEQASNCIGTEIVGHGIFIGEHALSIEWNIKEIKSRLLSNEEIERKICTYLRDDGSFFYHGVYGDYQQAYDYVKKNHIITTTQYNLSLTIDKEKCIIVDLWGHMELKRKPYYGGDTLLEIHS